MCISEHSQDPSLVLSLHFLAKEAEDTLEEQLVFRNWVPAPPNS